MTHAATLRGASPPTGHGPRPPLWTMGFIGLLGAQFLGSFNDNLFKMVVSLLAVGGAAASASAYLSLTGAVFVLPYLIFSDYAGWLADAMQKRTVLVATKLAEIAIVVLAALALEASDIELMLVALFLLATQATFFSPIRQGIVPELVAADALSRANGALEASRQLAVIAGTVAGGVALSLWRHSPETVGLIMIGVAATGFLAGRLVPRTSREIARRPPPRHPWGEVLAGLRTLATDSRLRATVAGTTWFDFVSALALLDLLLVARQTMGLNDAATGSLAGIAGLATAAGALLVGQVSRGRIEIGLVPVAGVGVGAALFGLTACTGSFAAMAVGMAVLGVLGGIYVVPLYANLQASAAPEARGRVIGTNNVLNMAGVLLASGVLWLLIDIAAMTPTRVLGLVGLVTALGMALVLAVRPRWRVETVRALGRVLSPRACV